MLSSLLSKSIFLIALSPTQIRCHGSSSQHQYPSVERITEIFGLLSSPDPATFYGYVAENVNWTLMGTHPLAGQYHNRSIFLADAVLRLNNTLDPTHPTSFDLVRVIGGGNEWTVQELHGTGTCKNGEATTSSEIQELF
jgi:ketosteroid isomerase-like protein